MTEPFRDGQGVTFSQYRLLLPPSTHTWPFPLRVKSKELLGEFAERWDHCQVCGTSRGKLDIHHLIGGFKGRSDEWCCLLRVCRACHNQANSARLPFGLLLWCKWRTARSETDWVRLALLHRRFLPDLIEDNGLAERYKAERFRARGKCSY